MEWTRKEMRAIIDFNPKESIKKGSFARKIPMTCLDVFSRKINGSEEAIYSSGPKFRNGDTLLARITPCLENGKTAFVDILDDKEIAFGSTEFIILRAKPETDKDYLYYLARSPTFRKRAISCMEGTSGRKRVNDKALQVQELPVPGLSEQKAIGNILSSIDAKIDLNNRINAELKSLARTIYDYWFLQFDFPDAEGRPYRSAGGEMRFDEELGREVPEGWKVKSIAALVDSQSGTINPTDYPDQAFTYYSLPGFDKTGSFTIEDGREIKSNKNQVQKDDILVSKLNPWYSRVILVEKEENAIASTEFILWRSKHKGYKNFLYQTATGQHFIAYCTQNATGTSNSHKRVNPGIMLDYKVPFDDAIVEKYSTDMEPMLNKVALNRRENAELSALRDWLLPLLMSGEVRVGE